MILLSAPAGYSKTTCLAEWAASDERPFSWITLSRHHNDPAVLAAALATALERIERIGPAPATPSPATATVAVLLRSLKRHQCSFVLVLDDAHHVTSAGSIELLEALAEALPAGSQLALGARSAPSLPLGRMRGQRRLFELGSDRLAMTRAEAAKLLESLGLALAPTDVDVLFERTEGWPAALYLAGTTILLEPDSRAAVDSFSGDDRIIVDYLHDAFLSSVSSARFSFMIRTSLLDELSGEACDAVLARSGSGRVLHEMSRSNSLVIGLDRHDRRYRYHHLLGDMLRSELHRREPECESQLHARASAWYAAHSDVVPAIDHAIAAGATELAGQLIWQAYPEVSGRGRLATVEAWFDELGAETIASVPRFALAAAHHCFLRGNAGRAAHWGRVAAGLAERSSDADAPIEGDLRLLEATLARHGVLQMGVDASRASELLAADSAWQSHCHLYRGVSSHLAGQGERALLLLKEAARRGAVVSPITQVLALTQLCLIAVEDEDWEQASRLIDQAHRQARRCGLDDYPSLAMVFVAAGLVRAHEGLVGRAAEEIKQARKLLGLLGDFPAWYEAQARLWLVRAESALGAYGNCRELLDEASEYLQEIPDATILRQALGNAAAWLQTATAERRADEWTLTTAELRTLQYLPSHLSFREIAERIIVSPNTVKTQAQAVYRKLDVSSRTAAVERARAAGLLSGDPLEHRVAGPAATSSEPGDEALDRCL